MDKAGRGQAGLGHAGGAAHASTARLTALPAHHEHTTEIPAGKVVQSLHLPIDIKHISPVFIKYIPSATTLTQYFASTLPS